LKIVAATSNRAKIVEFQQLTGPLAMVSSDSFDHQLSSDEGGGSFEANASGKAVALSRQLDAAGALSLTIASDGGLLIPGLGTAWNPLRTRRFAGDAASDLDRAHLLLKLAESLDDSQREIEWREAVAIANQGKLIGVWCAESEPGLLASSVNGAEIGRQPGFWIPTVWLVPRFGNLPMASLTAAERESIDDHWRKLQEPVRGALAGLS
jgi:inosine/xanthosine triphosphate pyrophosphatase family protein